MNDFSFDDQLALTTTSPSILSIAQVHAEGRLVLRPAFQRNLVWNDEQRSYLIDSILRNFPIPELYVHIDVDERGVKEIWTVVDGQQRLSTCIAFLGDRLRLTGRNLGPAWAGRLFSELDEGLKRRFKRYELLFRKLPDISDEQIREIFQRLNRVVEPLLPQELRHAAYTGPYINLIETIAAHPVLQEVRVFSARDFRRRGNDELIAEVVHANINGAFPNKKEGVDAAFLQFERNGIAEEVVSGVRRRFGRVFAQLEASSSAIKKTRFSNKSDFYSLVVLLLQRAESLPLTEDGSRAFDETLLQVSSRVAEFRKAALEEEEVVAMDENDERILRYMRAVERAASDRLNRVKRNDALEACLGEVLASGAVVELAAEDEAWTSEVVAIESIAESEAEAERADLRRLLDES